MRACQYTKNKKFIYSDVGGMIRVQTMGLDLIDILTETNAYISYTETFKKLVSGLEAVKNLIENGIDTDHDIKHNIHDFKAGVKWIYITSSLYPNTTNISLLTESIIHRDTRSLDKAIVESNINIISKFNKISEKHIDKDFIADLEELIELFKKAFETGEFLDANYTGR